MRAVGHKALICQWYSKTEGFPGANLKKRYRLLACTHACITLKDSSARHGAQRAETV